VAGTVPWQGAVAADFPVSVGLFSGHRSSGIDYRDEQAEAEVGTVTESKWADNCLRECDSESVARTISAIAVAVVASSLELERTEPSVAKFIWPLAFAEQLYGGA
jgi:hypothetical protein